MPRHRTQLDAVVNLLGARFDLFCDLMVGDTAPIITAADALQSLLTVEATRPSMGTGQAVALRDLS